MKRTSILILLLITMITISCNPASNDTITTSAPAMIDTASGSCPHLTHDDHNNIVLSWVKQDEGSKPIFCYAISQDNGKSFGKPITIPGSTNVHPHGENLPKVIFKPSGEIIAAWGAANPNPHNQYSGLVYYSQSFDDGNTWTKPAKLSSDTSSYDERYFDMVLLPDGEAGIVWLDNRKQWKGDGSGLYMAVTKGKNGLRDERLISGPCCQCCRTDLFIDRNKNIHVTYRAIVNDSIRDIAHIVSTDNGETFSNQKRISEDNWVISGCPHTGPAVGENKEGLQFAWFTGGNNAGIYYNSSEDNGKTFSGRSSVSGARAKHCQLASLDDNILIVWEQSFPLGNEVSSRIGIEEKNPSGETLIKDYITSEGSNASFPVIYPVSSEQAVVAYTENSSDKEHVLFKLITLP